MGNGDEVRFVSLSEVKSVLKKLDKDRKEMLYEQRIALEHAQKFAKLPVKKTNDLIKELMGLDFLEKIHAYKIADMLPVSGDEVKSIFAKERVSLGENELKKILEIIGKYLVE